MSERRRSVRSRCLVGAQVFHSGGKLTLSCMARNITSEGCLLEFGDIPVVPKIIDLQISNRKELVPAEVVWRDGRRIGVSFQRT